jgi:exodeoxyribonuclease VII small subunit
MTDELHPQLPDTEAATPGPESVATPGADSEAATPAGQTYEAASERLEEIIKRLDSGTAGLRETLDLVKEARALVDYCATELDAVGKGLDELRLDELIARLDSDGRTP